MNETGSERVSEKQSSIIHEEISQQCHFWSHDDTGHLVKYNQVLGQNLFNSLGTGSKYNKQLLDEVFVICGLISILPRP